ncbi:FAD-binding oxidoreductase [Nocardioides panacisoli]|uniref:FAD-dependent oxidoreductase n=1 Tax=Nocardioides panacisoli TaxID=627624 RepID=UPI001C636BC6|nr:FAD-dependent oxidoreductase [Nocardioides panacisoli]QYJ05577.1 FAD-binding oxidoreductase [Nocardioides panacisoli]
MSRVIVVGAGVVGLTAAVRLAEAGHRVDVVARDRPRETTSSVAAALWYPYLAAPHDRVAAWAARAREAFVEDAEDPRSGVTLREGTEAFSAPEPDPWWASTIGAYHRTTDLPQGFVDGWRFTAPVIEMPVHLDWLVGRLEAAGGTLTRMNLSALPVPGDGGADVVVNCTGLGSRLFGGDLSVVPVRGQVVVVEQVGLAEWWLAPSAGAPTYVIPRSRDIVLGGTEQHNEWSRTPDPTTAGEILSRAARLVPEVADAKVIQHKVGLRPARPEVRLERVGDVIHCYGHGGAGVTLGWGCADEVVSLLD